jgi:hypothetical protein
MFDALTDQQLERLRDLLEAGEQANKTLGDGVGFMLIAAAHQQLKTRALSAAPSSDLGVPPAVPPITPHELSARLRQLPGALQPSRTSTTKWAPVTTTLAAALALPATDVYVTSVGGLSRNIAVRLSQSAKARKATVAAIVWADSSEPIGRAITCLQRASHATGRLHLLLTPTPHGVDLHAIVAPHHIAIPPALRDAYPAATIHSTQP